MGNAKLVLVLGLDSHSKNASVGPLCNLWPIQLYPIGFLMPLDRQILLLYIYDQ